MSGPAQPRPVRRRRFLPKEPRPLSSYEPSSDRHLARAKEKVASGESLLPQHAGRVFARLDQAETERDQLRAALPAAPASEGAQPSQKGESP